MIDRLDLDNAIKPLYTRSVQPISEELWMEVDKLIEAATQRLVQDCFLARFPRSCGEKLLTNDYENFY